jgi:hypothetical protein
VFENLLKNADILLGYRADALEGLGYGIAERQTLAPGLIDVCLNAYGWSGPWQNRRGFDSLVQMSSGIAEAGMRWQCTDKPTPLPLQALDHATGYLMAASVIKLLAERLSNDRGGSARLSLARTAKLLIDNGPGTDALLRAEDEGDQGLVLRADHLGPGASAAGSIEDHRYPPAVDDRGLWQIGFPPRGGGDSQIAFTSRLAPGFVITRKLCAGFHHWPAPRHTCPRRPEHWRPMRIHVSFIDRVGITQEVLALLGGRNLNLDAVEMVPPNVYIDAPTLSAQVLEELRALFGVRGVQAVTVVDILPGQRRHLQLDALLAAMTDPVLAVDSAGRCCWPTRR